MPYSAHDEVVFALLVFVFSAIMSYAGRSLVVLLVYIARLIWKGAKHVIVRSKRAYVVYNHARNHKLQTTAHNEPLFVCLDNPCDTLFIDAQALGIPSEVIGATGGAPLDRI